MTHFMEYFGGLRENALRSLHKVFGKVPKESTIPKEKKWNRMTRHLGKLR